MQAKSFNWIGAAAEAYGDENDDKFAIEIKEKIKRKKEREEETFITNEIVCEEAYIDQTGNFFEWHSKYTPD